MILQPIDWYEHDVDGTYVIEVFGRLEDKSVVCVRLTGFKPYLYSHERPNADAIYEVSNKKWVQKFGPNKGEQEYAFKLFFLSFKLNKICIFEFCSSSNKHTVYP